LFIKPTLGRASPRARVPLHGAKLLPDMDRLSFPLFFDPGPMLG